MFHFSSMCSSFWEIELLGNEGRDATVIIAPPWPLTGSANIFAAIAKNHSDVGRRVLLIVAFEEAQNQSALAEKLSHMNFEGVDLVVHTDTGGRRRRRRLMDYVRWIRSGFKDRLAERATLIERAKLPEAALDFIKSNRVLTVHVNHCFNMLLAQKVCDRVRMEHGITPQLICETHDIQAQNEDILQKAHSLGFATYGFHSIEKTEIQLCSKADTLVHISKSDMDYFKSKLPRCRHYYIPPTITPENELRLLKIRGSKTPDGDFVYVGAQHFWNAKTVMWLLECVIPLVPEARHRLAIYGTIQMRVERTAPQLYRKYRDNFKGRAHDIVDVYRSASVILAPALGGSGSSIKLIEAMCTGRPVLPTTGSLRGLDKKWASEPGLRPHDGATEFANAMRNCLAGQFPAVTSDIYDQNFSNRVHSAAFKSMLAGDLSNVE